MSTHPRFRRSITDGVAARRLRVGDLVVDLGRAQVTREGREVVLPRLSFDLLVGLARVAPNVASYEELVRDVWNGAVVGPETVSQRVKLLRVSLGDDARDPRYVAAVRGRGYRLVPPVEVVDDEPSRGSGSGAAPQERPTAVTVTPASASVAAYAPPSTIEVLADLAPGVANHWRRMGLAVAVAAAVVAALAAVALRDRTGSGDAALPGVRVDSSRPAATASTVAVLPFETIGAVEDAYIGLGIAELLLNRLSAARSLSVVARSSSFALDARGLDAAAIGQRLGARFLVQGSVQTANDRVRVAVQLVDATTGRQLDAMRFDRATADLFLLQDEIAAHVAGRLDVTVGAPLAGSRDPEAHLAYLQGLELAGRWRVADADAAIGRFERARQRDPTFAAAYVGEANARWLAVALRGENPPRAAGEIRSLVDRALELDPSLGAAYVLRGRMAEDPVAAERDLRRGIELSPSDASGYLALGERLSAQPSRLPEALSALSRAIALDPLRPRPLYVRALARYQVDGSDEALREALREVLAVDPGDTAALTRLGILEASVFGRLAEGVALLERALAADPTAATVRDAAATVYLALGDWRAADEILPAARRSDALALTIALARGDRDRAAALAMPDPRARAAGAVPVTAVGTPGGYAAVVVVQDEALRSGRIDEGIALLRERHCSAPPRPPADYGPTARPAVQSAVDCVLPWTLPAATAIAHLQAERGERASGVALAEAVLEYVDSESARRLPFPYVATIRARALAVLGRRQDALRALESTQTARAGNLGWWVLFEHDPTFAGLRQDARFRAAFEATQREVAAQRSALETMRADGRVPRRPVA